MREQAEGQVRTLEGGLELVANGVGYLDGLVDRIHTLFDYLAGSEAMDMSKEPPIMPRTGECDGPFAFRLWREGEELRRQGDRLGALVTQFSGVVGGERSVRASPAAQQARPTGGVLTGGSLYGGDCPDRGRVRIENQTVPDGLLVDTLPLCRACGEPQPAHYREARRAR